MRHRRPELRIDLEAPAIVRVEPRTIESEPGRRAVPPHGEQHRVRHDPLSRFERDRDSRRGATRALDVRDRFPASERHVPLPHPVHQFVHDLRIEKLERALAAIHECHLGRAQRREHRGVLDADHAGPDDSQARGIRVSLPMSSLVSTVVPSHGTPGGAAGSVPTAITMLPAVTSREPPPNDPHGVRVHERGTAAQHFDAVPAKLVHEDIDLTPDHLVHPGQQLRRGGLWDVRNRPWRASDSAAAVTVMTASRKVLLGMVPDSTQTPPIARLLLDDRGPFAQLRGLDGRALPGRPAAYGEEIEVKCHAAEYIPPASRISFGRPLARCRAR